MGGPGSTPGKMSTCLQVKCTGSSPSYHKRDRYDEKQLFFSIVSRLLILYIVNLLHLFGAGDALSLTILDPAPSKMVCHLRFRNLFEVPVRTEGDLVKLDDRKRLKSGLVEVLVCLFVMA